MRMVQKMCDSDVPDACCGQDLPHIVMPVDLPARHRLGNQSGGEGFCQATRSDHTLPGGQRVNYFALQPDCGERLLLMSEKPNGHISQTAPLCYLQESRAQHGLICQRQERIESPGRRRTHRGPTDDAVEISTDIARNSNDGDVTIA
jgi:hypothetical protein